MMGDKWKAWPILSEWNVFVMQTAVRIWHPTVKRVVDTQDFIWKDWIPILRRILSDAGNRVAVYILSTLGGLPGKLIAQIIQIQNTASTSRGRLATFLFAPFYVLEADHIVPFYFEYRYGQALGSS